MNSTFKLGAGARVEMWAQRPGQVRILIDGQVVWQVATFPDQPGHFAYHHRETCEITVEWDNSDAILWAYSYLPTEVQFSGITVWEFGADAITRRTGTEIDTWLGSQLDRPVLHFSPIRQWMNDPNGLCKVGETWHLFYQFHPAGTDWGPMHWGHATSKDLFNWTHLPVFLHPAQNLWQLGATGGAFSGNAFHDRDGTLKFFYTERLAAYDLFKGYREVQKHAEPGRGMITAERITIILEDRPAGVEHDFRDPKVWWDTAAGAYRMVLGAALEGDPAVLLYGSDNLIDWTYLGPIYRASAHYRENGARAVECPDFFPLNGKWVMVMGFVGYTQPSSGRHNLLFALTGTFRDDRFVPDHDDLQMLDFGTDYYAMQSFEADGRQIALAWLFNWEYRKPAGSCYSGEMSLPRELSLDGQGRLCMGPVKEYEAAWPEDRLTPGPDGNYALSDTPVEIALDGSLEGTRIVATQNGQFSFEITVRSGTLAVRLQQDEGKIRYDADINEARDLRIIHDRGIIEIFAADGAVCGTRRGYMNCAPDRLKVTSNAGVRVLLRHRAIGQLAPNSQIDT